MAPPARWVDRAAGLGRLGDALFRSLPEKLPVRFAELGLSYQAQFTIGIGRMGATMWQRLATSILACDVPVQIRCSEVFPPIVAEAAIAPLPSSAPPPIYLGENPDRRPTYLPSRVAGAGVRGTLRFGDVYRDLCCNYGGLANRYRELSGFTVGFNDEQASACIIYAVCLLGVVSDPVGYSIRCLRDPGGCRALNTVIKAAGLNATQTGSMLCEAVSLQCKGAGSMDLRSKALERVGEVGAAGAIPDISNERLSEAIAFVLERELRGKRIEFENIHDFWTRRWVWAVNGGHSRIREKVYPKWAVRLNKGRVHRRAALEEFDFNPLVEWEGEVYVSSSVKPECGKNRMILACDTASYVSFEHLLGPIEKQWRNEKVLLDPGRYGHYGTAKRVRALGRGGGVWMMLDYDDFNSQHTLEAQKLVIEAVCRKTGYCPKLTSRLVDSFDKMYVYCGEERLGRASATLMSGHRGTTFINSVLNAAYVVCGIGREWTSLPILHTGDDVVMALRTYDDAARILKELNTLGIRMNPVKQSVGTETSEFLRVAATETGARGYLCRSIGAAASGNVISDELPDSGSVARTMVENARSISNRSGSRLACDVMLTAFRRRTGIGGENARGLLRGTLGLGDGPVFGNLSRIRRFDATWEKKKEESLDYSAFAGLATKEYLSWHATPVEMEVMGVLQTSVHDQMYLASYWKTLGTGSGADVVGSSPIANVSTRVPVGAVDVDELLKCEVADGILTRYPLLNLVKGRMSRQVTIDALAMTGAVYTGDPMVAAWGESQSNSIVSGVLSYSDASHYSKLTGRGIIDVRYPVAV